jgi:hypothetical protein
LQKTPLTTNNSSTINNNLSKIETNASTSLSADESIIIKEADKGGAVVIMDSDFYKCKILEMLNNDEFYSEIDENQDKILQKIRKLIFKNTRPHLQKRKRISLLILNSKKVFYGLPKVHKSEEIKKAIKLQNSEYVTCIRPEDLKFRPIVGAWAIRSYTF